MKKVKHLITTSTLLLVIACDETDSESTIKVSEKIDSRTKTYWHTNHLILTPCPQGVLIDMEKEVSITSVGILNRYAATFKTIDIKKIKIETSNDGAIFTSLGEFNCSISSDLQNFAISPVQMNRYLKITAVEAQRVITIPSILGESNIFGAK